MPSYKKKDGTIVKFTKHVPRITQKILGLRPARKIIKTSDIGKKGKKAGGVAKASAIPPDRSEIATSRMAKNLREPFQKKKKALREKFKGRGTAGEEELQKQLIALENKYYKKYEQDSAMAKRYGKDAYKSQAFGTIPDAPKRKKKSVPLKTKTKAMRGGGIVRSGSGRLSGYKVR